MQQVAEKVIWLVQSDDKPVPLDIKHCTSDRNLSKESIATISDCGFVKRSENILITGATGCGKSYLACAIGRQACAFGHKTLYF